MADIVVAEYGTIVASEAVTKCLELQGSICHYQEMFTYGIVIGFAIGLVAYRLGMIIRGRLQVKHP